MTYRIRIRVHDVEIEYEGTSAPEEPLVSELLSAVARIHGDVKRFRTIGGDAQETEAPTGSIRPPRIATIPVPRVGTVDNIVRKLNNGTTGAALVVATALYLTLTKEKQRITRADILQTAKDSGNHKKSFSSNLTSYLETAMKRGWLNETDRNCYTVVPEYLEQAKRELA